MIEEMKIIAEIMGGVTNGAIIVASLYMVLNFLKIPIIILTIGYSTKTILSKLKVDKK